MIPVPPPLPSLAAGTRLAAGLTYATILPDMDFESRSEAGFVWNEAACDWDCLPGAPGNKKGINVVGAAVYATHPTTDILSLKYNLKDGRGPQFWRPGLPLPQDLFDHIARGGLIEAHNSAFEHWIWQHVAVPRYGFPPLPLRQLRCSMAKARAHALPGALEKLGDVLQLKVRKDKDGDRLLKKFSIPRKPTLKDRRVWITPADDPADAERLYQYNGIDIESESEASSLLPDLSPEELEYWLCDQEINYRGVAVDAAGIADCIAVVEQVFERYNGQLATLTNGAVTKGSQTIKLKEWLANNCGVFMDSMDQDAIEARLEVLGEMKEPSWRISDAIEALELRAKVGSASIKKLFTIRNQMSVWNRIHDLINYHAARTGRDGGRDAQTQNLPKAGPDVFLCQCGHYFGVHTHQCPWCGTIAPPNIKRHEWSSVVYDDAFTIVATRDLDTIERFWGDAFQFVIGLLRALLIAGPGLELIASDYSAIEAVVTAAMAGCDWRMKAFREGKDIYLVSIGRLTGKSYEYYQAYKATNGKHHPDRQQGKVLELACFGSYTQVLTRRGYVSIKYIRNSDELWDGIEWVKHKGLISKGRKAVLNLDGVEVTPDHKIICGPWWKAASELASNESLLYQALASGSENLPFTVTLAAKKSPFRAHATENHTKLFGAILEKVKLLGAMRVLKNARAALEKIGGNTRLSFLMTPTAAGCSIVYQRYLIDAETRTTPDIKITVAGELRSTRLGLKIGQTFLHIWSRYPVGTIRRLILIAKKLTATTRREIYDLSLDARTNRTAEKSKPSNCESDNLRKVYDIANAGPRNRFTIKTNSGHLIVHNCGYGGWIGSIISFGGDKYMTELEMRTNVLAWRDATPEVPEMWGGQFRGNPWRPDTITREYFGLEGTAIQAVLNPGQEFTFHAPHPDARPITYVVRADVLYCILPSGRPLAYHRPRLIPASKGPWAQHGALSLTFWGWNSNPKMGPMGWTCMDTYGGKLAENVVQAVARDILRDAVIRFRPTPYKVVLRVHDEIVAEKPKGAGSLEEFERLMGTMPAWATGWPVVAKGGWIGDRYRKD